MSAESSLSQFPVCTLFKLLVATGLALFLASCASTSSGSKPRHQFQRIAIIAFGETREDLQADSPAKMYATGFLAGGAGGAEPFGAGRA